MEFHHRLYTRVVGFVDLILGILTLINAILSYLFVLTFSSMISAVFSETIKVRDNTTRFDLPQKPEESIWPTVNLGIDGVLSVCQLISSIALINSTSTTNSFRKRLHQAYFWVGISTIIFVFYGVLRAITGSWIFLVCGLVLRVIFMYGVLRFVGELRQAIERPVNGVGQASMSGGVAIPPS